MRRRYRAHLTLMLATSLLWAQPLGAAAAPAPETAVATPALASAPVRTASVTLITGDRITMATAPDGSTSYTAAPPEGAAPGRILTRSDDGADAYFYPSDVIGQVGTVLDPELFNVSALIRDGFDDAHRDSVPLIVQHAATAEPEALEAGGLLPAKREFASLHARTAVLDKDDADRVGRELADATPAAGGTAPRVLGADAGELKGISRIWLDGKVKADALDRNLAQVGADKAWAAGRTGKGVKVAVLDTGADQTHPDLEGRISATADFTGSGGILDKVGHGTHVAATVAGSGAGAPGVRSGVAYDADLIVGKVLGDDGSGSDSQVIAGMEWAVAQGAKVVNMSLGSGATNGKDAVTTALEDLATSSDTLFVVSAGNSGPGVSTVSAPSIAPHALSVAAVDSDGGTASFSSRGPSFNGTVKPEIAAPGVDIVAARATGVTIGTIQSDPRYTALSGTSMAAPHVAGAAAVLAEEHPDWSADRLKHTLMSTATAPAVKQGVQEVGSGVVNVAAALKQPVVADTGAVDFGQAEADGGPITRTVELTNTGGVATTLDLGATLAAAGAQAPAGIVSVSPPRVDLPAGGSAKVTLTANADGTPSGAYSGALTATGGATDLRIPLVLDRAKNLTIRNLDRAGNPTAGQVNLLNADNGSTYAFPIGTSGTATVRVPDGRYIGLATLSMRIDGINQLAVVSADLAANQKTIVFDARTSRPWNASVKGRDTRQESLTANVRRSTDDGKYGLSDTVLVGGAYGPFGTDALWITPTTDADLGTVLFNEHWRLADAESDHFAGDSSVLYDLAFTSDKVPADPRHILTHRDLGQLAKVNTTHRGMNESLRYQEGSTPYGTGLTGLNVTSPSSLTVPRSRTEYITAQGVSWLRFSYRRALGVVMDYSPQKFTYTPGRTTKATYFEGPLSMAAGGQITGARLQLGIQDSVNAVGRPGMYADFNVPQRWSSTTRLYRDGVLVADKGSTIDETFADAGPASYELTRSFTSQGIFPMGGEGTATWKFSADGRASTEATPVSLLNATFDVPLDDLNRARPGRALDVTAQLTGAQGRLHGVRAWVTADGGKTWTRTAALGGHDGRFHLTARPSSLVSGGFLGLRLAARDSAGGSLDLALPRAIPVR
ncbi:S8 family serine peptidase [Streptomyces sp. NPDC048428]|uniref:S8 family peptidase n=1 Tax=Streptomyces sp. NPDC048428 TaxID=3154503 RepID=UPI00341AEEA1